MSATRSEERSVELRDFHLTGRAASRPESAGEPRPLCPVALPASADPARMWSQYPLVVGDGEPPQSLDSRVVQALEAGCAAGESSPTLTEHHLRLAARAAEVLERRGGAAPVGEALDEACEALVGDLELSNAGKMTLLEEVGRLKPRIDGPGELVTLGPSTLLRLYREALRSERESRRREFARKLEQLVRRLSEMLQLDAEHDPGAIDPKALSATLGDPAGALVDPQALMAKMRSTVGRGPKRLEPARRARIEQVRDALTRYLGKAGSFPECVIVHDEEDPPRVGTAAIEWVRNSDGMAAAVELFDAHVRPVVDALRAQRIARLEVESAYNPQLHDPILERFGWESCESEELLLVPPIVVLARRRRLRGPALASFSELLLSGRPIHVLVSESATPPGGGRREEGPTGNLPGLGYVAVAHREAFVLQSTMARPLHVLQGLRQMARAVRPAAALVAVPGSSEAVPCWVRLAAAHNGRGTACFRYDPDAGENWAERFDLSENPQPEQPWPLVEIARGEASDDSGRREAFTLAHALALDPAYRRHYRLIDPIDSGDDLVEIADYLAGTEAERRRCLPYLWVRDDDGRPVRAIATREMAFACRDTMRTWRILQELAGTNNEYARRAAEQARRAAEQEAAAERDRLAAAHAEELERVRQDSMRIAVERLVARLMNANGGTTAEPPPPVPIVAPFSRQPEAAMPPPAASAGPAPSVEGPYIDSALCTTCNECTNLNSKLFRYNENKQAYIADPDAGSYAQLVRAAEKCPARCIHPGTPRAGDKSATNDLVARAAAFN